MVLLEGHSERDIIFKFLIKQNIIQSYLNAFSNMACSYYYQIKLQLLPVDGTTACVVIVHWTTFYRTKSQFCQM